MFAGLSLVSLVEACFWVYKLVKEMIGLVLSRKASRRDSADKAMDE